MRNTAAEREVWRQRTADACCLDCCCRWSTDVRRTAAGDTRGPSPNVDRRFVIPGVRLLPPAGPACERYQKAAYISRRPNDPQGRCSLREEALVRAIDSCPHLHPKDVEDPETSESAQVFTEPVNYFPDLCHSEHNVTHP
ncbi:hypothetical protein EVAR_83030_1 [Eumeta japonica]|uniref:Uncharacterized protein n=1 Tax=Eumeta variegata TaxID=151549 RepID=A0A4C1VQ38_EUMVA|nr:hypothetical protein EVAR_83030_1 [Eumeta japonica]